MAWLWLVSAGVLEVIFATCLKLAEGFTKPLYTVVFVIAAVLSVYCLSRAMQNIPIGTAYAVWTGIGAVGVAFYGIFFFGEPVNPLRITFLCLLIGSIIGLKLVSAS